MQRQIRWAVIVRRIQSVQREVGEEADRSIQRRKSARSLHQERSGFAGAAQAIYIASEVWMLVRYLLGDCIESDGVEADRHSDCVTSDGVLHERGKRYFLLLLCRVVDAE